MSKGNRIRKNRKTMTEAIENVERRGLRLNGTHENALPEFLENISRVRDNGCEIFSSTVPVDNRTIPVLAAICRDDVSCTPDDFMAGSYAEINQWAISTVNSARELAEAENMRGDFEKLGILFVSKKTDKVDIYALPIDDFIHVGRFMGIRTNVERLVEFAYSDFAA